MARSEDRQAPAPGSFYRHSLKVIQAAHPDRDAAWHRQQAREIMSEAYEARRRLLPDDDDGADAPVYPRAQEDLVALEEDFKAGATAGEARWHSSSTHTSGRSIQVALVRGIVCLRVGEGFDSALFLTQPEWRIFAQYLKEYSLPAKVNELAELGAGVTAKIAKLRPKTHVEAFGKFNEREWRELVESMPATA